MKSLHRQIIFSLTAGFIAAAAVAAFNFRIAFGIFIGTLMALALFLLATRVFFRAVNSGKVPKPLVFLSLPMKVIIICAGFFIALDIGPEAVLGLLIGVAVALAGYVRAVV